MNDISFVWAISYGDRSPREKYIPAIKKIGKSLCLCYGISFPRKYAFSGEPIEKMRLTRISTLTARYIVRNLGKIFKYPDYYTYWSNIMIFDALYCKKVAKDDSKIVFTSPLLIKTIKESKKAGKIVVVEAGNSEPEREHRRVVEDYKHYQIKKQFIYGNSNYARICKEGIDLADYVISISKVSLNTYLEAGYNADKFKLISMAGTDFPIQKYADYVGKKKVFISTAHHNFVKGTQNLLMAWKKAEIENVPLLIVGKISDDLQEFLEKYGPFKNVEYIGNITNLKEWYKQFDAMGVLMSLSEGAVRVTPEMMSFGFPMIVSPDATCDLVEDGYNGRIIETHDIEKLAKTLRYYANDWSKVHEFRENVLKSVSIRKMSDYSMELADYLLSLLENRGK